MRSCLSKRQLLIIFHAIDVDESFVFKVCICGIDCFAPDLIKGFQDLISRTRDVLFQRGQAAHRVPAKSRLQSSVSGLPNDCVGFRLDISAQLQGDLRSVKRCVTGNKEKSIKAIFACLIISAVSRQLAKPTKCVIFSRKQTSTESFFFWKSGSEKE